MKLRSEEGVTLIEVVLGIALFTLIMAPLTLQTFRSLEDLFDMRTQTKRTENYTRSAYLLTSGLAYAQLPLLQAFDERIEYKTVQDDGERYIMVWRDCTSTVPGIYAAVSAPRRNLMENPSFERTFNQTFQGTTYPERWTPKVNGYDYDNPDPNAVTPPLLPLAAQVANSTTAGGTRTSALRITVRPGVPQRQSYTWLESQVYPASPGTRFLVGGYMAESVVDSDVKRRPRIEWYWTRSVNGRAQVIAERSGALTTPDTDKDTDVNGTPDGGLDKPSNDFSTWRWKLTRPAPPGADGIQIRLTAGLITGFPQDTALFDGVMLQPISGPRAAAPHRYFDGAVSPSGGVYAPSFGTANRRWVAPIGSASATADLSPSLYGSESFSSDPDLASASAIPTTSNVAGLKSQLLFRLTKRPTGASGGSFDCDSAPTGSTPQAFFTYQTLTGNTASSRLKDTRQVVIKMPVFGNPQTADNIRFPVGSIHGSGAGP